MDVPLVITDVCAGRARDTSERVAWSPTNVAGAPVASLGETGSGRRASVRVEPGTTFGSPPVVLPIVQQFGLVLVAALTYFGVRGLTESDGHDAVTNARSVMGFERHLGIDIERWLQAGIIDHHWIVTGANWVYIWGHWPAIIGTMVWLYRSRIETYRQLRNALFISGAIGLVIFAMFPVAPPRLADHGFVDTVTELSHSYRVLQPPSLVNKYAAVPSLHVGWNFLVGMFVWRHAERRWVRNVGAISPAFMAAAVVLTANHYVIDGVIGIAVASIGLLIATRSTSPSPSGATGAGEVPLGTPRHRVQAEGGAGTVA